MSADLAVLGLGTMGGRCAARAVDAGLDVVGFDPVAGARETAGRHGVRIVDDPGLAAQQARVLLVSVPLPEHVAELAAGPLQRAAAGTVVVDLSTIDPGTAREAHAALAARSVVYVDAPVLGRPERCGAWTLVAGGPATNIDQVTPTLEKTIAARVVRVGDVGAGSAVKLLNNLMFGAINAVTAEALTICRSSGVDPAVFVDAVAESGAATVSNLFKELAPRMVRGDDEPAFSLALLAKDNRLAVQLAQQHRCLAPMAASVDMLNTAGLARGYGGRDTAAVHRLYAALSGEGEG
ncbi:MAG: NAD(P)-dependent oxidoreductase [Nocardioidaceae bacterium]